MSWCHFALKILKTRTIKNFRRRQQLNNSTNSRGAELTESYSPTRPPTSVNIKNCLSENWFLLVLKGSWDGWVVVTRFSKKYFHCACNFFLLEVVNFYNPLSFVTQKELMIFVTHFPLTWNFLRTHFLWTEFSSEIEVKFSITFRDTKFSLELIFF